MKERFYRFMQGRYGADSFSRFLIGVNFVLILLSLFVGKNQVLAAAIISIVIYVYFRTFSKNISRRYAENQKYLAMTEGIRRMYAKQKYRANQRKTYRFYRCPSCSRQLRVPKGKGKIEIDCPNCHTKFIKRS